MAARRPDPWKFARLLIYLGAMLWVLVIGGSAWLRWGVPKEPYGERFVTCVHEDGSDSWMWVRTADPLRELRYEHPRGFAAPKPPDLTRLGEDNHSGR